MPSNVSLGEYAGLGSVRKRRKRRTAFTLVELIVVLVIMGVLLGMSVFMTTIAAGADYEIRSKARQIAGTMEAARNATEMSGVLTRLFYDLDAQLMLVYRPKKLSGDEQPEDYNEDDLLVAVSSMNIGNVEAPDKSRVWLDSVQTYDGRLSSSGQVFIDILPTGTPVGHIVNLRSKNEERFSIELNPLTGAATIYHDDNNNFRAVEPPKND